MSTVKKKKTQKEYSYEEYLRRFRPKSLRKNNEEDELKKPLHCSGGEMAIQKVGSQLENQIRHLTTK